MAFIGPYQVYTIDGAATVARVVDWDTLATSVNSAAATAESNAATTAKNYTDGQVSTDRGRLSAIETAAYVPEWKANTAYLAGRRVIAPNGDVVSAKVDFTSTGSYNSTNWNASTQDGRLGVLETNTVPIWKATTAYTTGQRVVSPGGDIVSAKATFTSGASYDAANWNPSADQAKITNLTNATARISGTGLFQYLDAAGALVWQINTDGTLGYGTVPWARLNGIPSTLAPVKCVRLENGAWVWDTVAGTHYVIPDDTGQPIIRTTQWPVPSPTTPLLDW